MTRLKPPIHGRDHVPGGADPIPNWPTGGVPALVLHSSDSMNGDASWDIPAYTGVGGAVNGIPYQHAQQPSDTSWYALHYLGGAASTPPYDAVAITASGVYLALQFTRLVDNSDVDAWFGVGIVASSTNAIYTPEYANDVHVSHMAGGGSPAMSEDGSDGHYFSQLPLVVESGKTGQIFVQAWHQDNRIVTIYPEQTLTILKLA